MRSPLAKLPPASSSSCHSLLILLSLTILGETFNQPLTPKAAMAYVASLSQLTQQQFIQAFSRAVEESKFFPVPALLRELAGMTTTHGDPEAAEAKAELFRIVAAMRGPHGPKLKDIPGRVLYGTAEKHLDEHGKLCCDVKRAAATPFLLARRTDEALIRLGWGCRTTGTALIAESPIVSGGTAEDGEFQTNRLRTADELLAKWTAACPAPASFAYVPARIQIRLS